MDCFSFSLDKVFLAAEFVATVAILPSALSIASRHRVILDSDLAELYGVPAKRLNQQVTRNADRYPRGLPLSIVSLGIQNLRLQLATSSLAHGGRSYLPYAFTEHGAIMAATVLNSERAIQMSLFVVRAFVRMREALAANQQIVAKLAELERRIGNHDGKIQELVAAIRELMVPPPPNRRRIGFETPPTAGKPNGRLITLARGS